MTVKHHQRRRLTGRMSLFVSVLGLLVFFGSAQAASAVLPTATNATPGPYFGQAEGCPGEIVKLETNSAGPFFAIGGGGYQKNTVKWLDKGVKEQFFGPTQPGLFEEVRTRDAASPPLAGTPLPKATLTVTYAVIPYFFQVWEGPQGFRLDGEGKIVFTSTGGGGVPFTYINLYTCIYGGERAQAVSGTAFSISTNQGCPGDIVTFSGTGFPNTPGVRRHVEWVDQGVKEQYGPLGPWEKRTTDALERGFSTTSKDAVVPFFHQVWEHGPNLDGPGTVKFEGTTFPFTYTNLYTCF